jgi:3-methyladenine DNA glycosylase AlkD
MALRNFSRKILNRYSMKENTDMKAVVREVLDTLSDLSSEKRRKQILYFAPGSQDVVGVSNPDLKEVIKALREKYKHWDEQHWIALCKALVACDIFECQVLAYEIIGRNKRLLNGLTYKDLMDLWRNLDNWASVDHFSVGIFGVLWGKGVVKDEHIDELLMSGNFWDRRVAVVSTVALNLKSRGGTGDTPRTLAVCEKVVDDREDLIRKALSWSLRELSKRDPQAVRNFIATYQNRLAGLVIREVNHKLDFGTKN